MMDGKGLFAVPTDGKDQYRQTARISRSASHASTHQCEGSRSINNDWVGSEANRGRGLEKGLRRALRESGSAKA